jgi:Tfp pilus assembly protein PilV
MNNSKDNKKILKDKKSQKGFALVEVVVALGVSALVITALVSLSISTLRTSLDSKLLLEGTKIANRQIELVRAYRDGYIDANTPRSWEAFIDDLHDCEAFNTGYLFSCHMGEDGSVNHDVGKKGSGAEEITYQFIMTNPDGTPIDQTSIPPVVRISVSVTWKVGDQEKGSYIYTDLSNWRGR